MPDLRISQLSANASCVFDDVVPINDFNITKKTTLLNLKHNLFTILPPQVDTFTRSSWSLNLTGTSKWSGGVLATNGKIYGIPQAATTILIVDNDSKTATQTDFGITLGSGNKWTGGVLGRNGKIYCVPLDATDILIVDPVNLTATRSNLNANLAGANKWTGGCLGRDNKIYCAPGWSDQVLIIDPALNSATTTNWGQSIFDHNSSNFKYFGTALGNNGIAYGIPHNADNFLVIDTINGPQRYNPTLVIDLPMNDTTTVSAFYDRSTYNRYAQRIGTLTTSTSIKRAGALCSGDFTAGGYLRFCNASWNRFMESFTIDAWVYLPSANVNTTPAVKKNSICGLGGADSGGNHFCVMNFGTTANVYLAMIDNTSTVAGTVSSTNVFPLDQWVRVTVDHNRTTLNTRLCCNTVLEAQSNTVDFAKISGPSTNFFIGRQDDNIGITWNGRWGGYISDFKINTNAYSLLESLSADNNLFSDRFNSQYTDAKYAGAVTAADGRIYLIPWNRTTLTSVGLPFIIIDSNNHRAVSTNLGLSFLNVNNRWYGGSLGLNGEIYCAPHNETGVLIIDPITNTATITNMGLTMTETNKFAGSVVDTKGRITLIPFSNNTTTLLPIITPNLINRSPLSIERVISGYYNKL
jgi:hypothetical protein